MFGVGERSVHAARKWLASEGFLTQEYVHQLVKNRCGGKFVVNLKPEPRPKAPVRSESAPPFLTKIPCRSLYQRSYLAIRKSISGVRVDGNQGEILEPPTLRNILPEDLKRLPRLEELYRQAVQGRWLAESEVNFRNFICAALRATRAGGRVGAIFVGIVRKHLWHHITQEQEERALQILRRYREPQAWNRTGPVKIKHARPRMTPVRELLSAVMNCESCPESA